MNLKNYLTNIKEDKLFEFKLNDYLSFKVRKVNSNFSTLLERDKSSIKNQKLAKNHLISQEYLDKGIYTLISEAVVKIKNNLEENLDESNKDLEGYTNFSFNKSYTENGYDNPFEFIHAVIPNMEQFTSIMKFIGDLNDFEASRAEFNEEYKEVKKP